MSDPLGPLLTQVTVPADAKEAYLQRYPASDYIVGETQAGSAQPSGAGANSPSMVTLKIYLKRKLDSTVSDLAKQILTISATVLVTIIGFYFGSNSAADAARSVKDALSAGQSGDGDAGPGEYPGV